MSISGASPRANARFREQARQPNELPVPAPSPTSDRRPLLKAIVGVAVGLAALYLGLYLVVGRSTILGDTPWNVPTVYTFVALSSFLVAFVALGRYTVLRAPETYWIGTAFAAFGLQSILFVLSWPGLRLDGSSILRTLPATSGWIGVVELATLGGLLLAAALCRWPTPGALSPRTERASVVAVLAVATFPCVLLILLDRHLPAMIDAGDRFSAGGLVLNIAFAFLFGAGAVLSTRQYRQAGDALKGYVALTQIAWTFVIAGHVIGGKRYDLWYYLGRILQAGAALTMLFGLLADYVSLLRRERARSAELQEAHRRLEEAHAKKDRYLSMLSHELRNPLAAIASATTVLGLRVDRFPELRRAADVAARQVRHMSRLLDDLLDVARITRGQIVLRREMVDLRDSIGTALEMIQPKIVARRHTVDLHLPPDAVPVNADRARLVQVVANLLDNAAKYTPDGGRVTVSARRDVDDVVITVRDNGGGIPSALRPHLFHPLERGQISLGGAEGGLGLGLALVRELAELHGGEVRLAASSPAGSEFELRLPALATGQHAEDDEHDFAGSQDLKGI